MQHQKKRKLRQLRKWRIRKKVAGTPDCPRMAVFFSNQNIHVQFIDDTRGVTLAAASTVQKSAPDRDNLRANVASAKKIGTLAAVVAKEKGITRIVFDRSGARFHGKVKALADAAREGGLQF
ncbi:MAG TPA: 50S ribosomal protein L18 [Verrucomicrobiae bacterium]|jgi:large subunit ribosomal protein L18|nr:50S ribosomal protein L18 [Verrucomicrobiae bacterium]